MAGFNNDVVYGTNIDLSGQANPAPTMISDGQLMIARTSLNAGGTHVDVNTLTPGSGISITNGPGTITIASTGATTDLHTARFIVSPGGSADGANYTTIASAITAAVAATGSQTIFIQPGIYTENLTLQPNINLAAYNGDQSIPNVTIVGKISYAATGSISISNIQLKTNSDYFLEVTGNFAAVVNLNYCFLNCTNHTGINFTAYSSASSAILNVLNCDGNLATTGIAYYVGSFSVAATKPIQFIFKNCLFKNTGLSTVASNIEAGATTNVVVVNFINTMFDSVLSSLTSSNALIFYEIFGSYINTGLFDTVISANAIKNISAGFVGVFNSYIVGGGSNAAIIAQCTVGAIIQNSFVSSGGTLAIDCTGFPLSISGVVFNPDGSSSVKGSVFKGGSISGLKEANGSSPAPGFLGEQIRSAVALTTTITTTATPQNITSISLTAGIWDISGIVEYNQIALFTSGNCSISTTSATLGTNGDNNIQVSGSNTSNVTAVVPAWRLVLTSTTTVYLVGYAVFTGTQPTAGGRISATRVG